MKIRTGFVSNSSSSSFVCDVCGENASGWDMCLFDAEMVECVNGHTVCDDHVIDSQSSYYEMSFEEKRQFLLKIAEWESTQDSIKAAQEEEELDELYEDDLRYEERYNTPAEHCPCCTLVSPTSEQVLTYLLYEKGRTRKDVEDEMRTRFATFEELEKKLTQ